MKEYTCAEICSKIKELFNEATPLDSDCGRLCDKSCCKGDSETGMVLFPGETTSLPVVETNGRKIAVCEGVCQRENRPVSCMIFPLFPVLINGKIKVWPDYRGAAVCPMVNHFDEIIFSKKFIRAVKKTGKLMLKNRETTEFLNEITEEILLEKELEDRFLKEGRK